MFAFSSFSMGAPGRKHEKYYKKSLFQRQGKNAYSQTIWQGVASTQAAEARTIPEKSGGGKQPQDKASCTTMKAF